MSPSANTSGCPGRVRSGSTVSRPARSSSRPAALASVAASSEAVTPAAQIDRSRADVLDLAVLGPDRDRGRADVDDGVPDQRSDAELLERARRLPRQRLREARQDAVGSLDEQNARRSGVDRTEVARQRVAGELGDLPGHLDPGRPGADDDERQPVSPFVGVALDLGRLERAQDAVRGSRARRRTTSAPGRAPATRRGRSRSTGSPRRRPACRSRGRPVARRWAGDPARPRAVPCRRRSSRPARRGYSSGA